MALSTITSYEYSGKGDGRICDSKYRAELQAKLGVASSSITTTAMIIKSFRGGTKATPPTSANMVLLEGLFGIVSGSLVISTQSISLDSLNYCKYTQKYRYTSGNFMIECDNDNNPNFSILNQITCTFEQSSLTKFVGVNAENAFYTASLIQDLQSFMYQAYNCGMNNDCYYRNLLTQASSSNLTTRNTLNSDLSFFYAVNEMLPCRYLPLDLQVHPKVGISSSVCVSITISSIACSINVYDDVVVPVTCQNEDQSCNYSLFGLLTIANQQNNMICLGNDNLLIFESN